jgi:hypothetical protein
VPAVFDAMERADVPEIPADGLASEGDVYAYWGETMDQAMWRAVLEPLWGNRGLIDRGSYPTSKADGYISQGDLLSVAVNPNA